THGKTTTTGMVSKVLIDAGLDPTVVVGGEYPFLEGGNARSGGSDWIVVEACEAYGGLEWLSPTISVVTSMDPDHLDYHGTETALRDAYCRFARRTDSEGTLVWCADDAVARDRMASLEGLPGHRVPYGVCSPPTMLGAQIEGVVGDGVAFLVRDPERMETTRIHLGVPGRHNVANALAAWAVGRAAGVSPQRIARALEGFQPAGRRFERLGERDGILVIDDYAHHPAEVRATLAAARSAFPARRIVAVFQPHLPSRTRAFLDEFASALAGADRIYLADIYLAREAASPEITSAHIASRIVGPPVVVAGSFDVLLERLRAELVPGDVLLVLGAGDIRTVGERFVSDREVGVQ
ncbi:MAG: UDP-N-acetylmuramate--L-alanine ligase, partial [Armatimonadota bacterium]